MFGKVIGAIAGNKAAKHVQGVSGTGGTLLGFAAPMVIRRLGTLWPHHRSRKRVRLQALHRPAGS
ncbi:hypothetical protein BV97_05197 [Novosphingobium resinovorum]|uniref:Uncharacterized protein n=1 Tax=Novosphingobium resinovorum TaxID=158500 RepID=A0A031JE85_9SPHN|nr:hypothetical protein BV97_05197 [Novosphingobium resinovorum]